MKNKKKRDRLLYKATAHILTKALYNPDLHGASQPITRPDYRVVIQTGDKNSVVVLDVYDKKDNVEIVGWRELSNKKFEQMKRQAQREGGQFLILSPQEGAAAALSALPSNSSSADKSKNNIREKQEEEAKFSLRVGGVLHPQGDDYDGTRKKYNDKVK